VVWNKNAVILGVMYYDALSFIKLNLSKTENVLVSLDFVM